MKTINNVLLASSLVCAPLMAQFSPYNNLSLGSSSCPRRDSVGSAAHDGNYAVVDQPLEAIVPKAMRKSVADFGVQDPNGNLRKISDCLGKVVVIIFWSPECDVSINELEVAASMQRQAAQKKMQVEVWPVHTEGWPKVLGWLRSKKQLVGDVNVYRSALGDNGIHVLSPTDLPALPEIFIVDRQGRLADSWVGYHQNQTISRLNQYYQEP